MPAWQKFILFFLVVIAHFGLLAAFNFENTGLGEKDKFNPVQSSVVSNSVATRLIVKSSIGIHTPTPKASVKALPEVSGVPVAPPISDGSIWGNSIRFFDANEVDKTADMNEDFDMALEQRLPVDVQSVILEFWIAKDGSTLQVICLEGECSDAVRASLEKLSDLKFTPATKGAEAVASRKVVQIDIKPKFGL